MSALVLVLLLLFMTAAAAATTSLDFQLLHEIESGGAVVAGWSNVSSAAAMKHYHHQCLDKEREALLLFKAGLVDYYGLLSSWGSTDLDCCKWWGVHCSSRTGHVIELHLQAPADYPRVLRGKITPSLLELHHLSYLDLSSNVFSGQPIPQFMGSLSKLNYLDLSGCYFNGTIPPQLGNLSNLNHLAVGYSFHLATDLDWLPHLTSLQHLDLWGVDLSKANHWVDAIKSLPFLSYVDFSNCQLSSVMYPYSLSSSLNSSTSISTLHLSSNYLTSPMIDWLFNFSTSLVTLTLFGNQLNIPTPKFLRNLCRLQVLELFNNNITGNLEDFLNNLQAGCDMVSLEDLDARDNHLIGSVPDGIIRFSSLRSLYLGSNELNGTVSENLGTLSKLESLDLSLNSLQGTLLVNIPTPKFLRNLCRLQVLELFSNNITGNLEDFLNNLQAGCAVVTLEYLDAGGNHLIGSVPDGISRFSSLRSLNLGYNELNGTVSENLWTLSKLESLDLHVNSLKGPLSENLGTLSKLERLHLSFNSLQGPLFEAHFLNLTNLDFLDLSHNSLALEVSPHWIPPFQLTYLNMNSCKLGPNSLKWISQTQNNLSYLDIGNCGISAKFPESFWNQLSSLVGFNISGNQIRGKVPDFPPNFPNHTDDLTINLSSNHLEGPIPLIPPSVRALDLSKNNFSGSLSMLCQITNIEFTFLDLSQNSFTGGLPNCLLQFSKLMVLNLAYNKLSENLSTSSGSLFVLTTLNLSNNSFFGDLPLFLRNCTSLSFLDLGANKFSGNVPAWIGEELQLLYTLRLRSNMFDGVIPVHLCHLTNLQILDLSTNSFFGSIPSCLNNLSAMAIEESSIQVANHYYNSTEISGEYFDYALVKWQGRDTEFKRTLGLLKIIDLSSNQLKGEVPNAIMALRGLVVLNLSRNKLHGRIPEEIGQMKSLLSLNFSGNELSGHIPRGMSMLSFLNNLDLSHNKLSGGIPPGTQLQSFDSSAFAGNSELCGSPLPQKCPGGEPPVPVHLDSDDHQENNDDFLKWLYIGMSTGFITGFWAICGALLLNHRCRHAFFRFFDSLIDSLYVQLAIRFRNR